MVCETTPEAGRNLGYANNGKHPNSVAALARNRLTWKRCSREVCNRPAYSKSLKGFCWRCWKKWESHHKQGNDPHNKDMARLRFYKKMGPKLQAFVEECLLQPESDIYNLSQELAISRDLLDESLGLYEAAKQLAPNHPHKTNLLATAGNLLATASKEVRETCRVGAEVFNTSKDKYSVHTLLDVVAQIKRIIRICFEHDTAGLNKFDWMLDNELRLPKIGNDGTYITADQDVLAMDETVPRIVDSTAEETVEPIADLLLYCDKCELYFNHPDDQCVCSSCNGALIVVEETAV